MSDVLPSQLAGQRGGAFLLFGDDAFQRMEAERALVESHLDPATRDFNYDLIHGSQTDPQSLLAVLSTPPMMAEWRVVVLRETEALAPSAKARKALLDLVGNSPPGLALIMVYSLRPGRRPAFFTSLRGAAAWAEFRRPSDRELPRWIEARARSEHDIGFQPEAARALAAAIGNDLGILARETAKLAEFAGGREAVTLEDVKAVGTRIPTMDRWRWFDLVAGRSFEKALSSLGDVMRQVQTGRSESVVGLVGGLSTQFMRMGIAVEGGEARLSAVLPARQAWLAERIARQSRGWTASEIESALDGLLRVDSLAKSSPHDEVHFLEEWLLGLMTRAKAA